jgi:hypothetical protein
LEDIPNPMHHPAKSKSQFEQTAKPGGRNQPFKKFKLPSAASTKAVQRTM